MARVLVIDDEPDVRWLIRMSLERAGHEVIDAEDGLRGIALATKQHPEVIVLDLMMPVMDGYGVLAELAKDPRTASVPVVVLSAKAIPDEAERAVEAGARRFLEKPFDPDLLTHELADLLDAS
jgi:twitching motility two-component system response regulator PilH